MDETIDYIVLAINNIEIEIECVADSMREEGATDELMNELEDLLLKRKSLKETLNYFVN